MLRLVAVGIIILVGIQGCESKPNEASKSEEANRSEKTMIVQETQDTNDELSNR